MKIPSSVDKKAQYIMYVKGYYTCDQRLCDNLTHLNLPRKLPTDFGHCDNLPWLLSVAFHLKPYVFHWFPRKHSVVRQAFVHTEWCLYLAWHTLSKWGSSRSTWNSWQMGVSFLGICSSLIHDELFHKGCQMSCPVYRMQWLYFANNPKKSKSSNHMSGIRLEFAGCLESELFIHEIHNL